MAKKKAAQKAQKPGPQKEAKIRRKRPERPMSWFIVLLMITIFQVWSAVQTIFEEDGSLNAELVSIFGIYIAIEWLYVVLFRTIFKKKSFELELIAFFLSGIGLVICASVYPNLLLKQFISVLLGLALFIGMVWFFDWPFGGPRSVTLPMPTKLKSAGSLESSPCVKLGSRT